MALLFYVYDRKDKFQEDIKEWIEQFELNNMKLVHKINMIQVLFTMEKKEKNFRGLYSLSIKNTFIQGHQWTECIFIYIT